MKNTKCDTMSCEASATHRLSWVDEFEQTVSERVCEPCGRGYANRPSLKAKLTKLDPQSGYTHCACRDCMETIVAKNMARPELCDDCHKAGCGDPDATTWPECQRDDAYGEC